MTGFVGMDIEVVRGIGGELDDRADLAVLSGDDDPRGQGTIDAHGPDIVENAIDGRRDQGESRVA